MHHIKVESSQIFSIAYDPIEERMEARFKCQPCYKAGDPAPGCERCHGAGHTGTYSYSGVPVEAYAAVRDARKNDPKEGSHGKMLNLHVKRGGKDGKGYPFSFTPHGA